MVDSESRLAAFQKQLAKAEWIGFDLEADSLHSYPEKVCLIQISIPGRDVVIDPLAGINLDPLWKCLCSKELIVHGCDYDLRMLRRDFDFRPARVFDTMEAARLVGMRQFGLGGVVEAKLGVRLDKASQKANWSVRPLTPQMEEYARNDTRHLLPMAKVLRDELVALGRLEWHREVCDRLIEEYSVVVEVDEERQWRLRGSFRFDPPALAVLKALWHWREREARRSNRPPFFILSHDRLLELARGSVEGGNLNGLLPRRMAARRRRAIRETIARARSQPPSSFPERSKPVRNSRGPVPPERFEALKRRRDAHAEKLDIDPTLIASRATLENLALNWEGHAGKLMRWQRRLLSIDFSDRDGSN